MWLSLLSSMGYYIFIKLNDLNKQYNDLTKTLSKQIIWPCQDYFLFLLPRHLQMSKTWSLILPKLFCISDLTKSESSLLFWFKSHHSLYISWFLQFSISMSPVSFVTISMASFPSLNTIKRKIYPDHFSTCFAEYLYRKYFSPQDNQVGQKQQMLLTTLDQ